MTFNEFVLRMDSLASIGVDVAQYPVAVPAIIEAAEQRIYRELDFLAVKQTLSGLTTAVGVRSLALPANPTFITLENVAVSVSGLRQPLLAVTRDLLEAVYANNAGAGAPQWFAMQDAATILLGPWPDQAYPVDLTGTTRPAPLSASNPTTWLATMLPDLFFAAAMAFVAAGAAGANRDAPNGSWEVYYQICKTSAVSEEQRKKFQGSGWTSLSAPSVATSAR